jgi:hypothetical protein
MRILEVSLLRDWKVSQSAGWKAGVTVAPTFLSAGNDTFSVVAPALTTVVILDLRPRQKGKS